MCHNVQEKDSGKKTKALMIRKVLLCITKPWHNYHEQICVTFEHIDVLNLYKTQRNASNLIINVQQTSTTIKMPKIFSIVYLFYDKAFYKKSNLNKKKTNLEASTFNITKRYRLLSFTKHMA
jgi:hypothetical protein